MVIVIKSLGKDGAMVHQLIHCMWLYSTASPDERSARWNADLEEIFES